MTKQRAKRREGVLGWVRRDGGALHVLLGDRTKVRGWRGEGEASAKKLATSDDGWVMDKKRGFAIADLGGAGQALLTDVDAGVVLAAVFPAAGTTNEAAWLTAARRPATRRLELGTLEIDSGELVLAWAQDALSEDALAVKLPAGRYVVYADDDKVTGDFGSVEDRVFVLAAGAALPLGAPATSDSPRAVLGSFAPGTGRIEVMIGGPEAATSWNKKLATEGFGRVGCDDAVRPLPGACMLEASSRPCVYAHLMASNEVHVVERPDGVLLVVPAFPAGGHGTDVALSPDFVESVSVRPARPTKVGQLPLDGNLVVMWAYGSKLNPKVLPALAQTGKAQTFNHGVALRVRASDYDVWFDTTPIVAAWGKLSTRCFLCPQGTTP